MPTSAYHWPRTGLLLLPLALAPACKARPKPSDTTENAMPSSMSGLDRARFNQAAAAMSIPVFWRDDSNGDGALDADELVTLWDPMSPAQTLVEDGHFTTEFQDLWDRMLGWSPTAFGPDVPAEETERRALVREELAQGRPTLVETKLSEFGEGEQKMVDAILAAAALVEKLYAKQTGAEAFADAAKDPESRALFRRNQGFWCVGPSTEGNEACTAVPGAERVSGLYPASLQKKDGFCESLAKAKNADALTDPFTVVRREDDALTAVPYHEAFSEEMEEVATHLETAAEALEGQDEAAFQKYLRAAAKAFRDGSWQAADEAWAAMSVNNSKWYLRIGPDEVYFEPCNLKAGFHVSFARINPGSLVWQEKLDPLKSEMEGTLAKLAGRPYKARDVSFHLPDFIDMVLNAGDSRSAMGATIGQSLPNWGPVANEGRGRTVAMTNLYTDADSQETSRGQAASVFCEATMEHFVTRNDVGVMTTVLHEAAHNLGPAHEYAVRGKTDDAIFGGPLASTLEELKAQTAALYLTDWLVEKEVISSTTAEAAHVVDLAWAFGHISRGMVDGAGRPKPYSQLSAVQLGHMLDAGVAEWKANTLAANGTDKGCLELDLEKFPAAAQELMKVVAGIKARGDVKRAKALLKKHVNPGGQKSELAETIRERWLRAPKASFVYGFSR